MARRIDHARYEGVKPETPEQERRRRARARSSEVTERAKWLLENDPDANDMVTARRMARAQIQEIEEHDARARKGLVDPETGELTQEGRRRLAAKGSPGKRRAKGPSSRRGTSGRPARVTRRFVRDTARTVTAPFGSATSAGWTAFQGGLSLVLLYVALRDADAISAVFRGATAGIRRIGDPWTPLFPDGVETAVPSRRRITGPVGTNTTALARARARQGGNL